MKKNSIFICLCYLFCFFVFTCFISCEKKSYAVLKFDNSQPLSLAPDITWALITEPYAAFHETLDWNSSVKGYCKRGDILQVISKSQDDEQNIWYKFEDGWIPKSSLIVYSNRLKAENAVKTLKD